MPSTDRATPGGWRIAAGAILLGGFGLGMVAGRKRLSGIIPVATAGIALGCAVPVALASRRPPITPQRAAVALDAVVTKPTFSVVVGARNEAPVLRQLVLDLSVQDYRDTDGNPLFELIVVNDRSTDGTANVVAEAVAERRIASVTRIVHREGEDLPDGKGAALTAAQPDMCRGDVVLVLDADARIQPWFLRRAAGYFAAGANAVTARRRILKAQDGWLVGAQADEQTLDGELNRGRWAMGGCSEFRGNGIMIRRDLLAEVGGWRASALTEDIDLSSRVAAQTGQTVAWALDAEVWEEPVRGLGNLWRQRLRWAEGAFRRAFEHGPALVRSNELALNSRLDFVAYVCQLAVPPLVAGAAVASAISGRRRGVLWMVAGYLGVGAILGWDSLRWERDAQGLPLGAPERAGRALRVSLFNGLWLFVVPRALLDLALRRGPIRYVKMDHDGAGAPDSSR